MYVCVCIWEGVCGLLCCLSAAAWQCQLPLPFTVNELTLTVCFSRVSAKRRPYLTYPVTAYCRGGGVYSLNQHYLQTKVIPLNMLYLPAYHSKVFSVGKRTDYRVFSVRVYSLLMSCCCTLSLLLLSLSLSLAALRLLVLHMKFYVKRCEYFFFVVDVANADSE